MILFFSLLSGILGRMGGSGKWNTKWRDCGIASIITLLIALKFNRSGWLILIWLANFGALTTYWDWLFKKDNFWFSGFIIGLCVFPLSVLGLIRAVILSSIWGLLNKYTPKKILFWRGDIANEFIRYASIIITLPIIGV